MLSLYCCSIGSQRIPVDLLLPLYLVFSANLLGILTNSFRTCTLLQVLMRWLQTFQVELPGAPLLQAVTRT